MVYLAYFTIFLQEAQLNEVLSASNLDPTALTVVTRKLEVSSNNFLLKWFATSSIVLKKLVTRADEIFLTSLQKIVGLIFFSNYLFSVFEELFPPCFLPGCFRLKEQCH